MTSVSADMLPPGDTTGARLLWLCHRPNIHTWVRRRVDTITVLNEATIRHEVSYFIDLRTLNPDRCMASGSSGTVLLPIERLGRGSHVVTTVTAPNVGELMRPTQETERLLVIEGLTEKWEGEKTLEWNRIAKCLFRPLPEARYTMGTSPKQDRSRELKTIQSSQRECRRYRRNLIWRWWSRHLPHKPEEADPQADETSDKDSYKRSRQDIRRELATGRKQRRDVRTAFRNRNLDDWVTSRMAYECAMPLRQADRSKGNQFGTDMTRWLKNYMVIVEVPTSALSSDGQIILTIRYDSAIPPRRLRDSGSLRKFLFRAFLLLTKISGGSVSTAFTLPVRSGVGTAASSHFSLTAPHGFRAVDTKLVVRYAESTEALIYRDDDNLPGTGHIHIDRDPHFVEEARLVFNAYAYKSGFFVESLFSSWLILAVVQTYYSVIQHGGFHLNSVGGSSTSGLHSELAAGLILLVPSIVVAVVTQRDQTRIASRCFALSRLLLLAAALASAAGAMMIALGVSPATAKTGWTIVLRIVEVVAARMTLGAVVHIYRCSGLRQRWLKPRWARYDKNRRDALMGTAPRELPTEAVR